jgi:uncharacterized cupin superfamily protein
MTTNQASRILTLNVADNDYPDTMQIEVRTSTATQVGELPSPADEVTAREVVDFPTRWLRQHVPGGKGIPLGAGLIVLKPCVLDFTYYADETLLIVSGAIDVVDDEGNVFHLRSGDMAYFAAGTRTTWTVLEESVELFTLIG